MTRLSSSCDDDYFDDKYRVIAEYRAALGIKVNYAVGIDRPFTLDRRIYRAHYWVEPENTLCTNGVICKVDPYWGNCGLILLRRPYGFLNVEVVKSYCKRDPCTSTGEVVVGRSRIPLPSAFNIQKTRSFPLAKLDGQEMIHAGDISICMELIDLGMFQNPQV